MGGGGEKLHVKGSTIWMGGEQKVTPDVALKLTPEVACKSGPAMAFLHYCISLQVLT